MFSLLLCVGCPSSSVPQSAPPWLDLPPSVWAPPSLFVGVLPSIEGVSLLGPARLIFCPTACSTPLSSIFTRACGPNLFCGPSLVHRTFFQPFLGPPSLCVSANQTIGSFAWTPLYLCRKFLRKPKFQTQQGFEQLVGPRYAITLALDLVLGSPLGPILLVSLSRPSADTFLGHL